MRNKLDQEHIGPRMNALRDCENKSAQVSPVTMQIDRLDAQYRTDADYVGAPPQADGPCHPYTWQENGERIDDQLQPAAWRMVNHLWSRRYLSASFDQLEVPIYNEHDDRVDNITAGSLRSAANRFFKKHNLPYRVCIKQTIVYLSRLN